MAEKHNDIDKYFREKFVGNSINPSPMAWEHLEGRLSQKKKRIIPWMKIAASILLLAGLTATLWLSIRSTQEELETLAAKDPVREIFQEKTPAIPEIPAVPNHEEKEASTIKKNTDKKPPQQMAKPILAATKPAEPEPSVKEKIPLQVVEPIDLPPLDTNLSIAENSLATAEVEGNQEISYKITIISNGIKAKPEKESLVEEIENKIDKIGGLIGKVDQGFAELQDAKNNLFASITTKAQSNN